MPAQAKPANLANVNAYAGGGNPFDGLQPAAALNSKSSNSSKSAEPTVWTRTMKAAMAVFVFMVAALASGLIVVYVPNSSAILFPTLSSVGIVSVLVMVHQVIKYRQALNAYNKVLTTD